MLQMARNISDTKYTQITPWLKKIPNILELMLFTDTNQNIFEIKFQGLSKIDPFPQEV